MDISDQCIRSLTMINLLKIALTIQYIRWLVIILTSSLRIDLKIGVLLSLILLTLCRSGWGVYERSERKKGTYPYEL